MVETPNEFLIKDKSDPLAAIMETTYPLLLQNMHEEGYLQDKAILAPTHDIVDTVNEYMLSLLSGEDKVYLNSDTACKAYAYVFSQEDLYTPEFLNSI